MGGLALRSIKADWFKLRLLVSSLFGEEQLRDCFENELFFVETHVTLFSKFCTHTTCKDGLRTDFNKWPDESKSFLCSHISSEPLGSETCAIHYLRVMYVLKLQ